LVSFNLRSQQDAEKKQETLEDVATPLSTTFQVYFGRSILLLQETGIPGENHRPVESN
jgi:hypothetical protein